MSQWRAMVTIDYKGIIIGYSPDFNEAVIMRKQAEDCLLYTSRCV